MKIATTLLTLLLIAGAASAETYYIAPEGADDAAGTSAEAPLNTFDVALEKLRPGDKLILLDGKYTPENSGDFFANGGSGAVSGTESSPIHIVAQNERQAHIAGDGRFPFRFQDLSWWVIDGIQCSADDSDAKDVLRGDIFLMTDCQNMVIRRLLAHHNNRHFNSGGVSLNRCQNSLVEECELYFFHRNGFSAFQSDGLTFRRCYANSRGCPDLAEGRGSHAISQDGGDASFTAYYSSNCTFENCVSEYKNEGFSVIGGMDTAAGNPSGENVHFLGCISIGDHRAMSFQSRNKGSGIQAAKDCVARDFLVVQHQRKGVLTRAAKNITLEDFTIIAGQTPAFEANFERHVVGGGKTIWPSSKDIGGSTFRLANWLIVNTPTALSGVPQGDPHLEFVAENFLLSQTSVGVREPIDDASGLVQHSSATKFLPDLAEKAGQLLVPAPVVLPGSDTPIGANLNHRYEDRKLVDQSLWNTETGAFPQGAQVEINLLPDKSLVDLHERIKVAPPQSPINR